MTGSVAANVTGNVSITDPVAATQSGDWTVGLDAASHGHLSSIDASTAGLTYDGDSNLNVSVEAGQIAAEPPNASLYGSFAGGFASRTGVTEAGVARLVSITVTALGDFPPSDGSDGLVQVTASSPGVVGTTLTFSVRPGQPVTMSFPYPIAAESIEFFCIDFTDSCGVRASWSGLAP